MKRRTWIQIGLAAGSSLAGYPEWASAADVSTETAVEKAHHEIWRRFFDRRNVMLDFVAPDGSVEIPTPEECQVGKPNALGWWSPIENGAMFNGMYMDAMVNRWRVTGRSEDAEKARKLKDGLLFLNSISEVPGFVGRGVSTDGKSHYAMGSNDQTFPWIYGLWRYLNSGIADEGEAKQVLERLTATIEAIIALDWKMPAEEPFRVRGSFAGFDFEGAPRLLFVCKAMASLTGKEEWKVRYENALSEVGGKEEQLSRLQWCERGMEFGSHPHSWTSVSGCLALRGLWELEEDPSLRAHFAEGLERSAELAMESLPLAEQFDNADTSYFEYDWKIMNEFWKPQETAAEAQEVAKVQLKMFSQKAPRRGLESKRVREPCFAAWIVTLAPDPQKLKERSPAVKKVIGHFDFEKLIYSQFFPVEAAWWRLRLNGQAARD